MPKIGETVYYSDALNDEFSGISRPPFAIGADFPFLREGRLYRFFKYIVYRVFVTPFAFLYCKCKFRMRAEGREKLRAVKGGYMLYGNHTQVPGDGLLTNVVTYPRETHVLVNSDNVALPGTRTIMQMLGALPIPTARAGFPPFTEALHYHLQKGRALAVFPEAHIWPYATVIRPFSAVSFRYPVMENVPTFAMTVTYRSSKKGKPRMVTYVDGPFFGEGETVKARQHNLRDQVYAAMKARADAPENVAFIRYVERENA